MLDPRIMLNRALLVENDRRLAAEVGAILAERCHCVTTAAGAEDAERALREGSPDLSVIDIEMPDWEGLEAIARIRFSDEAIPIIAITRGEVLEARLRSASICGADLTLLGPPTPAALIAAIDELVRVRTSD